MINTENADGEFRRVLLSDKDIFGFPKKLAASHEYDPGTLLECDEWFCLSNFSTKPYSNSIVRQISISSVNYKKFERSDFGSIRFLCARQDKYWFFQRITPSKQLVRKVIDFGDACKYVEKKYSIPISDYADAIYIPPEDKLYFRKLREISAIFKGIDELYREATEAEVKNFLDYNFIQLTGGFSSDNVKTNNRKRIAMALETLRSLSKEEQLTIFNYIRNYCPELDNKDNKFTIHNEDTLKKLLYGIEQRYYTTPVGEERRLANSVISLK